MEIRETSDYMQSCDENFEKERRMMKCNEEMKKKKNIESKKRVMAGKMVKIL